MLSISMIYVHENYKWTSILISSGQAQKGCLRQVVQSKTSKELCEVYL